MAVNPRFLFDMTYSEGPSMTAVSQSIFVNGELITRQLTEADKKKIYPHRSTSVLPIPAEGRCVEDGRLQICL